MNLVGRAAVARHTQQLEATFKRAAGLSGDPELLSDFARYLCILVSGYLEQSVIELVTAYVRSHSSPRVQGHVEGRLRRFTTANSERITTLLGSFDDEWRKDLEKYLVDRRKDAVNSVINLRQACAHGRYAGVTYARIREYYESVKEVVDHLADLCDPAPV